MSNDERIEDVEQNVFEFNIAPFEMSREDKERMLQKENKKKRNV